MAGETWTEYAVQWGGIYVTETYYDGDEAAAVVAEMNYPDARVVGRTVTATDWLPVEDGAA